MLIHLDEKLPHPDGHSMKSVQSKAFIKTTSMNDFPIRGKRVLIRRRKWVDKITGRSISGSCGNLKHPGTNDSTELARFLKDTP